jgi:hypothetical protein
MQEMKKKNVIEVEDLDTFNEIKRRFISYGLRITLPGEKDNQFEIILCGPRIEITMIPEKSPRKKESVSPVPTPDLPTRIPFEYNHLVNSLSAKEVYCILSTIEIFHDKINQLIIGGKLEDPNEFRKESIFNTKEC